jgi:DNA-binding response OmpR family regulator
VTDLLVASDAHWLQAEIRLVLEGGDVVVRSVDQGSEVRVAMREKLPDLVILDLQIGNMGGIATCMDVRLEEGAGRLGHAPVLILLDRRPDVFLARRSGADGWLLKPINPIRLRAATVRLLEGGTWHDDAWTPKPVLVPVSGAAGGTAGGAAGDPAGDPGT